MGLSAKTLMKELFGTVWGNHFPSKVAESDGRLAKNRRLGTLPRILRISTMWWEPAHARAYLPHAPGVTGVLTNSLELCVGGREVFDIF